MPIRNYKSWKGLKKQLEERLCDKLQGRIQYDFTSFRYPLETEEAKILLDKKDLLVFSWNNHHSYMGDDIDKKRQKFNCRSLGYSEQDDFLIAATNFLNMDIAVALHGNYDKENLKVFASHQYYNGQIQVANIYDYIEKQGLTDLVKLFAIVDKRVGKRTLIRLIETKECENYPKWLMPIFELRCEVEGINFERTKIE